MIDRKIDSFITTNNGINTHTYTGNELGKKAFVAKTSNVVSNTYPVIDGTFYDKGIENDADTRTWTNTWGCTIDRGSEYSTINVNSGETLGTYYKSISGDNICFEIDVKTTQGLSKGLITLRKGSATKGSFSLNQLELAQNTWYHFKIELKDKMYIYVDGVAKTPLDWTNDYDKFCLHCSTDRVSDAKTYFKNFVYYPI